MSKLFLPAIALLVALVLLTSDARARELQLGVETTTTYDSNVFSRTSNELDDVSFRVSPKLMVEEARGDLTWKARLQPFFEYYVDQSPLRGPEYDAEGELRWRITPRTSVSLAERFRRFSTTRGLNEASDVAAGDTISSETQFIANRDPFISNSASVTLTHNLTRLDQVSLVAFHSLFDYNEEARTDNETLGAILAYERVWSARTRLGSRLRWSRQKIEPFLRRNTETDFVTLSGRVTHDFDPTLQVNFEIGPTLVFSDDPADLPADTVVPFFGGQGLVRASTCPTFDDGTPFFDATCESLPPDGNFDVIAGSPVSNTLTLAEQAGLTSLGNSRVIVPVRGEQPGSADTDLTFFADISLVKRWADNWTLRLGFRRSETQGSSEVSASSISNDVYGRIVWRTTRKLRFTLRADWTLSEEEQQVTTFLVTAGAPVGLDSRVCLLAGEFPNCAAGLFSGRSIVFPASASASGVRPRAEDADSDRQILVIGLDSSYRLSRRLLLFSRLNYVRQDFSGDFTLERTTERYTVSVGVRYDFEPIHF